MPVLGSTAATVITPPIYNVQDYGALGDDSHDDTNAIQLAVDALKASLSTAPGVMGAQTLYFPPGYYRVTSTLDFSGLKEVRILGGCGRGGAGWLDDSNPPVTIALRYGNASTDDGVDMTDSAGVVWDGVSIRAHGPAYAGKLLNLDTSAAVSIFGHRIQNCVLSGFSGGTLVSMAGCIECSFDNVAFDSGPVQMVDPTGAAHWSNANSFRSCTFWGNRTYSIINPGPQTTLIDCTFEPSANVPAPIVYNALGNEQAAGLAVLGCGFWDNTGSGGSWIVSSVATTAFVFTGGKYDIGPGGTFFSLSNHSGLCVQGVHFQAANGGTPNVFDPAHNITNGSMLGCYVKSPAVDNHSSVFV